MKKKELLIPTSSKISTTNILSGKLLTTTLIPVSLTLMPLSNSTMIILNSNKITHMVKVQTRFHTIIHTITKTTHMRRKMTIKNTHIMVTDMNTAIATLRTHL